MWEKFENGVFTPGTNQMFSVHNAKEKFKNAATTGHFGIVLEETSGKEITSYRDVVVFEKLRFQSVFCEH